MNQTSLKESPALRLGKVILILTAISLLASLFCWVVGLFFSYDIHGYGENVTAELITATPTARQCLNATVTLAAPALLLAFLLLYPAKPWANLLFALVFVMLAADYPLSYTPSPIPEHADEATIAMITINNKAQLILNLVLAIPFAAAAVGAFTGLLKKVLILVPCGLMGFFSLAALPLSQTIYTHQFSQGAILTGISYIASLVSLSLLLLSIFLLCVPNTIPPVFPIFAKKKTQ